MKKVHVELTGITPLLMNNPASMMDVTSKVKKTTVKEDYETQAERVAYKNSKGELYIPATAIKGCLVNAAAYKKLGKHAARPFIAGSVFIQEDEVLLGRKKYDLDIRTVVIQRNRVVKARPKISDWKVKFIINYDDTMIADGEIIKLILEDGGKRIGILDFRPAKLGSFGMFEVTQWKEE